jgi:hypothetical protein
MKRSTAWLLGFGGALAFYWGAATFGADFDWVRHYRLLFSSARADATITSTEPHNHNTAHYMFQVDGHEYRNSGQGLGGVGVGDKIPVFYLPADPTFSTFKDPGDDLAFMIVAPLILSVLAGFGVMVQFGGRATNDS